MPAHFPPLNFSFGPHDAEEFLNFIETGPNASDLEVAVLLEVWQAILTPGNELRLIGFADPHPVAGVDPGWIVTSDVFAVAQDRSWCKATNRLYCLGRPAEVQGVDMPPSIRFPRNCRSVDLAELDELLAVVTAMIRKVSGA